MKYIICILFIALLAGCKLSPGSTAKTIKVAGKTCTSLCISATRIATTTTVCVEKAPTVEAEASSLFERTGNILAW